MQTSTALSISPSIVWGGIIIICLSFIVTIFIYFRQIKKFKTIYSELNEELKARVGALENSEQADFSIGYSFLLAGMGPNQSAENELRSARVRWKHLSLAFPQLLQGIRDKGLITVVSMPYTDISRVENMQEWVSKEIDRKFSDRNKMNRPDWIEKMGKNFDALRHPELAIASQTIYTYPFFLTWQRRHQWGVLPYATHTELGIVVRNDHPRLPDLVALETEYQNAQRYRSNSTFWIRDQRYAGWLQLLLEAAGTDPERIDKVAPDFWVSDRHQKPTIFSVGAYLQKELLPLACASYASSTLATLHAENSQQIEPTDFVELLASIKNQTIKWPASSAVVVDLALVFGLERETNFRLFRFPHCVYVPIGIGYSVVSYQILADHPKWTRDLLQEAGKTLLPAKNDLAQIGIELDSRLWTPLPGYGR